MAVQASALRSHQLIVTIYGLYARETGSTLPVAALVQLLGDLGGEAPVVRSSVSRLKRRGILHGSRENGTASYSISPEGMQLFVDGDARIYAPDRAELGDPWLLAVFSVPEHQRDRRHTLRAALTRLGFGSVTPGVWIAPMTVREQARHQLARLQLDQYVTFFAAEHLADFGAQPRDNADAATLLARWWDLESLHSLYVDFIERYAPVLAQWRERSLAPADDGFARDAFVDYIPMFTEWRRLPYLDPGLPLALLPENWSGQAAEKLFADLRELLGPPAHEYVLGVSAR